MDNDSEDRSTYKVVVNHEEQYSLWASDRPNAPGWTDAGFSGTRRECLAHIESVWTDMTPLSVRRKTAESGSSSLH
jgi:MbtH protein